MWHSMLVNVGKSVELPQGVRRELIPSVVRLQPLDSCLRIQMKASYFIAAFPGIQHPVAKDGELQNFSSVFRQGINVVVGEGEFIDEAIQGGAEVVEAVSDDEAELVRGRL